MQFHGSKFQLAVSSSSGVRQVGQPSLKRVRMLRANLFKAHSFCYRSVTPDVSRGSVFIRPARSTVWSSVHGRPIVAALLEENGAQTTASAARMPARKTPMTRGPATGPRMLRSLKDPLLPRVPAFSLVNKRAAILVARNWFVDIPPILGAVDRPHLKMAEELAEINLRQSRAG